MIRTHKYPYLRHFSVKSPSFDNNAKEHFFSFTSSCPPFGSGQRFRSIPKTCIVWVLWVSVMFLCSLLISIVFRLIDGICFLRNPLPAIHMYIIHNQSTSINLGECIGLTMLICLQIFQEDTPTFSPANITGCDCNSIIVKYEI